MQDAAATPPDALPEGRLLAHYAAGDRQAARELALRLTPLPLRVATRMLGDRAEAEDVAQEAMLRLWTAAPGWRDGEAKVTTWLYRVTVNLCTDRLRRRRTVPIEDGQDWPSDAPGALADLLERDRMAAFQTALSRLPERQCQAVVLRHLEGLANPEIARIMEIGVEAVESLVSRGKRALAHALSGQREALGYDHD
jgi:RNA polymerase sigma-70 factor (ECF subfamily)